MSNESVSPAEGSQNTQAADQTAEKQKSGASGSFNSSTHIAGMNDLKEKAPQLHRAMLEGIAMRVIGDMRRHAKNMKKIYRQGKR